MNTSFEVRPPVKGNSENWLYLSERRKNPAKLDTMRHNFCPFPGSGHAPFREAAGPPMRRVPALLEPGGPSQSRPLPQHCFGKAIRQKRDSPRDPTGTTDGTVMLDAGI